MDWYRVVLYICRVIMKSSELTYSSVNVSSYEKNCSANKFSEGVTLALYLYKGFGFFNSFILSKVTIRPVYLFARSSIMLQAHPVRQPNCYCQRQNL